MEERGLSSPRLRSKEGKPPFISKKVHETKAYNRESYVFLEAWPGKGVEDAEVCTGLDASTRPPLGVAPSPVSLPPAHLVHLNPTPPAIRPSLPNRSVPILPGLPVGSLSLS